MKTYCLFILLTVVVAMLIVTWGKSNAIGRNITQEQISVTKAVPALYPMLAAVAEESGTVVIEVKIKPNGTVAEAITTEGHQLFRAAAEKGASRWEFNSTADQSHIRVVRLTFYFKLYPKTTDAESLLPVFMPPYSFEIRGAPPHYYYPKDVDPPATSAPKQRNKRKDL
jgi:TonB family protein